MSEFNDYAYKLSWDVEHFERCGIQDWRNDIEIQDYEIYGHLFYRTTEFEHPNPLIFQGHIPFLEHIDYPESNIYWNIMSKRMYETLLSVGEFPHRVIPIVVADSREPRRNWYDSAGNLRKETCLWNYLAVQMTEHLDIFDYERSEIWKDDEDEPDRITDISKYVFKVPEKGLPPIFKIPERTVSLFVSVEARKALNNAKITGTRYISLTEAKSWVDNPIVLPD
jgi:hypothetical protein